MLKNAKYLLVLLFIGLAFVSCKKEPARPAAAEDNSLVSSKEKVLTASVSPFASGFNNPRGLEFGPDGSLYVAEAGVGGAISSAGFGCAQAPAPFGPYFGGATGGRVSKLNAAGQRTTVTTQLASMRSSGDDIQGPADIAFIGSNMYVLVNGGCSHGLPNTPAGIYQVNSSGAPSLIANLSAWLLSHPAAHPNAHDFEPDGAWYGLTAAGNDLYAIEANHGELVKVTLDGTVARVVDFSASLGHIVPTAIDYKGNFYVANLGPFPIVANAKVQKVTPDGSLHTEATGLSAVLGIVVDQGWMYVLEMTSGAPFPQPGAGRIIAIAPNGNKSVLVTGLNFPTGMAQGPDGNLYVSQWGFGLPPGGGQVLKVTLQ